MSDVQATPGSTPDAGAPDAGTSDAGSPDTLPAHPAPARAVPDQLVSHVPTHHVPPHPVPQALRTVASWSWRILVVLALVTALVLLVAQLEVLFVALFVALLVTALLRPLADLLNRHGVPRILATAAVLIGALAGLLLVVYLVGRAFLHQRDEFATAITDGIETVRSWVSVTFGKTLEELGAQISALMGELGGGEGGGGLTSSVFGAAGTAVEVVSGAGIALFATIFFVHDGPGIWRWVTSLFSARARGQVDAAGRLSWQSLSSYAQGTVMIAAIDAIGIGVGVALVGVPLAGPIAVLVFFGAFIPIVGAAISGMVAVLIALATVGLTGALIVLGVVIAVQQLEGHVLQPLIQGRMMALHPLAVVLAVAGGSIIAGIVGAVVAVPIVSVCNVLVRYTAGALRGTAGPLAPEGEPAAAADAGAAGQPAAAE